MCHLPYFVVCIPWFSMCFGFLLSAYIAIYNANEILQDVENDATNRLDENNYLGHTGLFCFCVMFVICLVIPQKRTTNYNRSSTQEKHNTPMKADECGYVFSYFFAPRSPIWQKHRPDVHFIRDSLCMIRKSVCIKVIVTSEKFTHFDGLNNPVLFFFPVNLQNMPVNILKKMPVNIFFLPVNK